jgi:hypothetical protein
MPISVFVNTQEVPVTFIVEPDDEQHEVPPLAKIGVRYSFGQGVIDRTFVHVGERTVWLWCDAEIREIEIVSPTPFDLLLWDICVNGGCCGGSAMHVTDLLPQKGTITAAEFAKLVIQAEEGGSNEAWLAARFVEHMGSSLAPAEALVQNLANPFDSAAS